MKQFIIAFFIIFNSTYAFAIQQAFLIQNSGWMEPFYQDSKSQFKPLVNAVIQTASKPNDVIVISTFNQSNALSESPAIIYKGTDKTGLTPLLEPQKIARKSDKAYADTDFKEAVTKTITGPFSKKSGVIWIFTNNKNSPGNDIATAERNKDFYALIHNDPAINKVVAFPLKMPVTGEHFNASGLMVYALAYGSAAEIELNKLIESGEMRKVLTQQPALLKPLNKEPVQLIPTGIKNSSSIHALTSPDKKTLIFDLEPKDVIPEITLTADLKNNFYPYNIAATKIDAKLILANGLQAPIQISQKNIKLMTDKNGALEFNLPIPAHLIVSPWSLEVFKAMGKKVIIPATINVTLYEQKLSLSDEFKLNFEQLFPGDPLSEIFIAPQTAKSSSAVIPVQFRLQYPLWPLLIMIAGAIFIIVALLVAIALGGKRKKYDIWVNGVKNSTIQLKPFSKQVIYNDSRQEVAILKRGLSTARLQSLDKETIVTFR